MALGLPRNQRLCRAADFDRLRRDGSKVRDSFFSVHVVRHDGVARLGVAVSRRVSTKAVERNRIKRQIRESFRLHQATLHGWEIMVVAQTGAGIASNSELTRSLQAHWRRMIGGWDKS